MTGVRFPASFPKGAVAAGLFCVLGLSCALPGSGKYYRGSMTCAVLDSLYRTSGFETAVSMAGRATFDVEQYRVRGQFNLFTGKNGEMSFEFSSSTLFGSRREEISLSIADGVIRVLDREGGRYYEGEDVDILIWDAFEADVDTKTIISLLLGAVPSCDELEKTQITASADGGAVFSGRFMGHPVRVVFGAGKRRLKTLHWPVHFGDGEVDQLKAEYSWNRAPEGHTSLRELVLTVERRGWRIKLAAGS